ncbi:hypothetical protein NDU88_000783 [Pleurodeles waltl]|uniref:Uncharacterized protein n=1 Tax=Pleurodeles waltl TaxID=8319 RepID=A0AAV7P4Q8_PLEWA|nr:hypothetical protein NDU88_000783 [Pleurodeles waltl]
MGVARAPQTINNIERRGLALRDEWTTADRKGSALSPLRTHKERGRRRRGLRRRTELRPQVAQPLLRGGEHCTGPTTARSTTGAIPLGHLATPPAATGNRDKWADRGLKHPGPHNFLYDLTCTPARRVVVDDHRADAQAA